MANIKDRIRNTSAIQAPTFTRLMDEMTNDVQPDAIVQYVEIEAAPKFAISETGAKVIGNVTEQDIINKLREVSDAKKAGFWLTGDLVAWADDKQWGSIYTQAAAITGKSEKTLRNYVWVCRSVHLSLRGENGMTLDHYKLIAPLTPGEQEQWVRRVQRDKWSSAQLKLAIEGHNIPAAEVAPKGWQKIEHAILKDKSLGRRELAEHLRRLADQLENER